MTKAACTNCHGVAPEDYMAVWEAMLEARRDGGAEDSPARSRCALPAMNVLWDRVGTVAMRDIAIDVTHKAVAGFEAQPADEQDGFDWEFVPDFLPTIDWEIYR